MQIRPEQPGDASGIRRVHEAAFGSRTEADLVDALRMRARPIISLVADVEGDIAGHILFSPVTLESAPQLPMFGLAPMAVSPALQRQGIGSALARAGVEECRRIAAPGVCVLGHAAYYPRFGFEPASRFGFRCEYDVPDDVFMVLELQPGALRGRSGTIRYHAAFAEFG